MLNAFHLWVTVVSHHDSYSDIYILRDSDSDIK